MERDAREMQFALFAKQILLLTDVASLAFARFGYAAPSRGSLSAIRKSPVTTVTIK
jgi:hypothetical protein